MINAIKIRDWVICGVCGCKLAGINKNTTANQLFIKCHGCKEINEVKVENINGKE